MYVVMNYKFKTESKNEEYKKYIENIIGEKLNANGEASVSDDKINYGMDMLWEAIGEVIQKYPNEKFEIKEGYWDNSTVAGECLDFEITYDGKELVRKCSDWYVEEEKGFYEDWEDFCDQHEGVNGELPMTEEEFNNWEKGKILYDLEFTNQKWVEKVPLNHDLKEFFGFI